MTFKKLLLILIMNNKHPKSYDEGQFVIIEYVNLYQSVINKVEKTI